MPRQSKPSGSVTPLSRLNRLVLSAAKIITLVQALVAIYSLQISLFNKFGEDEHLAFVMNSVFGGLLCIAIFGAAVYMVVRGYGKLKASQE